MALRPGDRYPTALALAADLEHWLADEPVTAYRQPWTDTARRWMRRHRMWVTSGAAVLVAALGFLTVLVVVINNARRRSVEEQVRTEQERARADANLKQALQPIEEMVTHVDQLADVPGIAEDRRQILLKALKLYQGLLDEHRTEPEIRLRTGQAHRGVGDINRRLGRREEAEEAYKRSLTVLGELVRDHGDDPKYRQELAASHNNLGVFYVYSGRAQEAHVPYEKALELWDRLAQEWPLVPEYRRGLAKLYHNRGWWHLTSGDRVKAEEAYLRDYNLRAKLADEHPNDPEHQFDLAESHHNLGVLYEAAQHPGQAQAAYEKAQRIYEPLAGLPRPRPEYQESLARLHSNRGGLYEQTNRPEEARTAREKALGLYRTLARDHPAVPRYHERRAHLCRLLAKSYPDPDPRQTPYYEEAMGAYDELARGHHAAPQDQEDRAALSLILARRYRDQGRRLLDQGQHAAAVEWDTKAVRTLEPIPQQGKNGPALRRDLAISLAERAKALSRSDRNPEALADWERALGLATGGLRDQIRMGRALKLARLGKHGDAVAEAESLARGKSVTSHTLCYLACVYAVASSAVTRRGDGPLAASASTVGLLGSAPGPAPLLAASALAERDRLAEAYARRAVQLLGRAIDGPLAASASTVGLLGSAPGPAPLLAASALVPGRPCDGGYRDLNFLRKDETLDALRGREDFNRLLGDLRQRLQREARPKAP
jgi:tetratricopeptide (TPR) repeat protein